MATKTSATVTKIESVADVRAFVADYIRHKEEKDAAYLTFKHDPTLSNATRHSNAANAFRLFCQEKLGNLYYLVNSDLSLNEVTDEQILAAIDEYKTCKKCERTIVYKVTDDDIIKTDDFIPGAKGWCYDCLVDHCKGHDCNDTSCLLAQAGQLNPDTCPYRALKAIHLV